MTIKAEYIGRKLALRRQLKADIVLFEGVLATSIDHAADPNMDEEERTLSAEMVRTTQPYLDRARQRLASLNGSKS